MRYTLDCEFDGWRGELISFALVREDRRSLHIILAGAEDRARDPWVVANVLPITKDCPEPPYVISPELAVIAVAQFLAGDFEHGETPTVIVDWFSDVTHLCNLLEHGPGVTHLPGNISFEVRRLDAYPCPTLPAAVRHNAWWDAVALWEAIEAAEEAEAIQFGGAAA